MELQLQFFLMDPWGEFEVQTWGSLLRTWAGINPQKIARFKSFSLFLFLFKITRVSSRRGICSLVPHSVLTFAEGYTEPSAGDTWRRKGLWVLNGLWTWVSCERKICLSSNEWRKHVKKVCYVDPTETHANLEIIYSAARLSYGFTATGSEHESDGRTQLKKLEKAHNASLYYYFSPRYEFFKRTSQSIADAYLSQIIDGNISAVSVQYNSIQGNRIRVLSALTKRRTKNPAMHFSSH